ncbi:MAG TPA: starvation-sensing protein RspA, partial [Candidatus Handelsmanbacteria bacterium]|nr:starvation-sensing protein RspA [Candidatus Handelsmanbacteria bacterium]
MSTVTIKDVQVIMTQPAGSRLIIVKLITSEPGLYGIGCATFTQRFNAVHTAIERHLKPFLIGRDVDRIEDIYQMSTVHSYWRNGPVLNNAISGVDQALWDIKGKRAGMPVYQLLGGKCREAAACY